MPTTAFSMKRMVAVSAAGQKILMCAKGYPPDVGGVQTYSEYVARAYLKAGMDVTIISSRPGKPGLEQLNYPEGRLRLFNVGEGKQHRLFARMLIQARALLAKERFDFVHPTTWRPALALAPWRGHVPMVLSVHGQEVLGMPTYLAVPMRYILRTTRLLVAVSRPTLQAARSALAGQTASGDWFHSHNGLSYEQEARDFLRPGRDPAAPVRIYSFCRLAERKNITGALRALRIVRDRGIDNFRYVIAGGGPMKAEIAALVTKLGLDDLVTMAGYIDESEIASRYQSSDIFLHPQTAPKDGADLEGFGLAIADAMSFGALAIVGSAGGPADFVTTEQNGIVVDGEDDKAIADAIYGVLTDEARLNHLATAGRHWTLQHLSWDHHVADILAHARTAGIIPNAPDVAHAVAAA